jgi:hypothetical protein
MILVQIATALAIGAYVVLSKDAKRKRPDATPRESLRLQHPADHLLDRDGRPELSAIHDYILLTDDECSRKREGRKGCTRRSNAPRPIRVRDAIPG